MADNGKNHRLTPLSLPNGDSMWPVSFEGQDHRSPRERCRKPTFVALMVSLEVLCLCWTGCEKKTSAPRVKPIDSQPAFTSPSMPVEHPIRVLLAEHLSTCQVFPNGLIDLLDTNTGKRLNMDDPPTTESAPPADHETLPGASAEEVPPLSGTSSQDTPAFAPFSIDMEGKSISIPDLEMEFPIEVMDLVPRAGIPIGILLNGKIKQYHGWIRFILNEDGSGSVVNVLDIEDYLSAVVAAELPAHFHQEAFRAQAIVARTYAWYHKQTDGLKRSWDLRGTERSQVYGSLDQIQQNPQASQAIADTRGLVCTWNAPEGERIFCTYYSSFCGGTTQSVAALTSRPDALIPPLTGNVLCECCRQAPGYYWGPVRIDKVILGQQLRQRSSRCAELTFIESVTIQEATPAGRPVRMLITDVRGTQVSMEAETFRLAADSTGRQIRSTFFSIADEGPNVVLMDGRGFGHGVGLCQYGADGMARLGYTASQILSHYYPTSNISRAY